MKLEILINGGPRETRVAILEDERLVELLIDRPEIRRTVGNIYLGKVEAVLPGMQAAFVAIGAVKSGFLHASDLVEPDAESVEADNGRSARSSRRLGRSLSLGATSCTCRLHRRSASAARSSHGMNERGCVRSSGRFCRAIRVA